MADIATEPKASTGNALISLLYVARGLRGFGDGFAIIILPAYMTALGYDAIAVGIVATASLLGTALLTLITGWIAPRHDLRALLIFGAGLMAATGLAFPGVEHFVLIVLVAFIGTINPSGGDLGVLVPLEHAVLAKSATDDRRTQVFARYSLIGALCTAAGSLAATLPDFLVSHGRHHARRVPPDVLCVCCARDTERRALSPCAACPRRGEGAASAARPLARHRLQARGAVQHRRFRGRFRRPVPAGAVAVRAFRPLAVGGRRVFLLVEHAERLFLSGRGLDREACRPRQHHGVHAYSLQHLSDPGGVLAKSLSGAGTVAAAVGVVADGRADPHLLRHGRGDAGGTAGGGQRHRRAAQPRIRHQSGDIGRAVDDGLFRLAAGGLRHAQDRLRPRAAVSRSATSSRRRSRPDVARTSVLRDRRSVECRADIACQLQSIIVGPEMDEEHPRLLVEHVAVDRGDLDIAGA